MRFCSLSAVIAFFLAFPGFAASGASPRLSPASGVPAVAVAMPPMPGLPEQHIVFGVDGVLVQGVPAAQAKEMDAAQMIQVGGRNYRVADRAIDVIRRLARNPEVRISFYGELPRTDTQALLAAISAKIPGAPSLASLAYRVLGREDLVPYQDGGKPDDEYLPKLPQKDLQKISTHLKNVVLIDVNSRGVVPSQEANLFHFHRPVYQYESFEAAQKSAAALKLANATAYAQKAKFFPATAEEWKTHRERMIPTLSVLGRALDRSRADFKIGLAGAVAEARKRPSAELLKDGALQLESRLGWKVVGDAVTGCQEESPAKPPVMNPLPLPICMAELPIDLRWSGAKRNECAAYTKEGARVESRPVDGCIKTLGAHYLWANAELKRCAVFTKEYVFVRDASPDQCADEPLFCRIDDGALTKVVRDLAGKVLYEVIPNTKADKDKALEGSCQQPPEPAHADRSPNKAYFEVLLRRGQSAPLSDFLKLWFPGDAAKAEDFEPYFFKCQDRPWGTLQAEPTGLLPEACRPDVLYSWGPKAKLEAMKTVLPDGKAWSGSPNPGYTLFTFMAPVSTFSYGTHQVRVKLRPTVPFKITSFGSPGKGMVGYRTSSYQDFAFDDASIIESWSYGTPEQYDEIVRDVLRLASGKRASKYTPGEAYGTGVARAIASYDSHSASEGVLKADLLEMIRMILAGEGRIHYAAGACRNRDRYFRTDRPTYFNPRARSVASH